MSVQSLVDDQLDAAIFEGGNEDIVTWSAREIANLLVQFTLTLFAPYSTDEIAAAVENYLDWHNEQGDDD